MTYAHPHASLALASMVGIGLALGGCAPRAHPAIAQARTAWEDMAGQPEVGVHAPVRLHEAERALRDAERDWEDGHDDREAEHDAYLVRRRLEIARATADRKIDEAAARTATARTSDVRRAARERALAALRARETGRGLELTLGDALFEPDRATLKRGTERTLSALVAVLREDPGRLVLIEGHTDAQGSDEHNRGLSDERANAVREYFLAHGIAPERIVANGYGEAYPVASNDTAAGRQQNRRVEVVILKPGVPTGEERPSFPDDPYGSARR